MVVSQYIPRLRSSPARCARRQRGQIMPIALFGIAVASTVLILMYRSGQAVTEKSELVNAADAAAYSGAVWSARHLNFMAYTNRAMIANHVTVGHFVSYVSWLRYLAGTVKQFKRFAQFIPYVGSAVSAINQVLQATKQITEKAAPGLVAGIDNINLLYRGAQTEVEASLSLGIDDLMERTGRSYDTDVRVNDLGDISGMPATISAPIVAGLASQRALLAKSVAQLNPSSDSGRLNDVINKSLQADDDLRRWVSGNRGWGLSVPCLDFTKQGSTAHSQSANSADWRATDRLRSRDTCNPFGSRSRTIGVQGSASAREFAKSYRGVAAYHDMKLTNNERNEIAKNGLRLLVVVTKQQNRNGLTGKDGYADTPVMGLANTAQPSAFMSAAVIEFKRPRGVGFSVLPGKNIEYPNTFNPFWGARLAKVGMFPQLGT